MHFTLLSDAAAEEVGEASEGVAGEGADDDADDDVAEVVLADEDAADGHHKCPEVHPVAVGLQPFRHRGAVGCKAELHTDEGAEGEAERVGRMCGEEAESAALFKDIQTVCYHKLIVQRTDSADCSLDEVGKLVAEAECEQSASKDEKSSLPA